MNKHQPVERSKEAPKQQHQGKIKPKFQSFSNLKRGEIPRSIMQNFGLEYEYRMSDL